MRFSVLYPGLLTVLMIASASTAFSAPANDNFANRIVLTGFEINFSASNIDATTEASDPSYVQRGRSVWWSWTALADGQVDIDLCGSDFDTVLAVYAGDTVSASSPAIAQNDDDPLGECGLSSRVSFNAIQGTTYQIAVDRFSSGQGTIQFHLSSPVPGTRVEVVPAGSIWKYLDDGSDQGTAWRAVDFDDSGWASGPAQLGYGDSDEATIVDFGPSSIDKYPTTYFRHAFTVEDPDALSGLTLGLVRDDGAVVYLNGEELFRDNMPGGTITYTTYALDAVGGTDENTFFQFAIPDGLLVADTNVLAVEIHQSDADSSDISFDLELYDFNINPQVALTAPTDGQYFLLPTNVTLSAEADDFDGTISRVVFLDDDTELGEVSQPPYTLVWSNPPEGNYLLRARAYDNQGAYTDSVSASISVVTNLPPVVAMINPTDGAEFELGSSIFIFINATDADGTVTDVEILLNGTVLHEFTGGPYLYTWNGAPQGSHVLIARATDNSGNTTESRPANIEVGPLQPDNFANRQPISGTNVTVTADNFGATFEPNEPVHGFDGGGSVWYQWVAPASGPAVVRATALSPQNLTILCAVYTGSSLSVLVPVGNSAIGSSISFSAAQGTAYMIAVDGFNGSSGEFTLEVFMAVPPANDDFADRLALSGTNVTITGSNLGATREPGEPLHDLNGQNGGPSVWWTWTSPVDSGVLLSSSGINFFNGSIAVYTGESVNDLDVVTRRSNSTAVPFGARAGTTYHLAVDGINGSSGPINLSMSLYNPPPNDDFTNSTVLSTTGGSTTGSLTGATREPNEPNHAGFSTPSSLWWSWTPAASGPATVSLENSDLFNPILAVYTGSALGNLREVASVAFQNELTFTAVAGTTYRIVLDDLSGSGGNFTLTIGSPTVFVPFGSVWKYLDNGTDQGTAWRELGFDDSAWAAGPGELGYGDNDEATVVNSGPPNAHFITTYFRHTVSLSSVSTITSLDLRLRRDDGAVVYVNGSEVYRSNLPGGTIDYLTGAFNAGDDGDSIFSAPIDPSLLVEGDNVIAVEIHQQNPGSSDISFDFELSGFGGTPPPSVTMTSPEDNSFFPSASDIFLSADASATDATIERVEFFAGTTLLGVDEASPFEWTWTNAPAGTHIVSAKATDSRGGSAVSAPVTVNVGVLPPLISFGAEWRFLDNGTDQNTAWRELGFDDSGWASGPAELGYGDGDEATIVSFGPSSNNKYITTYFRRSFTVGNASVYTNLAVTLRRDDGGIVYLNGVEVFRSNMPDGNPNYLTRAFNSNDDGNGLFGTSLNPGLLRDGPNVVAVEIHQDSGNSSDISFNLELLGNSTSIPNTPPTVALTAPTAQNVIFSGQDVLLEAAANDPDGRITNVEFFADGVSLGADTASPFQFVWTSVTAGTYVLTAAATDLQGATVLSAPVAVTVNETIPTVNDDFAERIALDELGTYEGSNLTATKEPGEPDHAGQPGGRSVWWSWTAVTNGPMTITTAGSSFDTLLAVYTGSDVGDLTEVAANDQDPLGGDSSRVEFTAEAGTVYHIAVDGQGGTFGLITLNLGNLQPVIVGVTPPPGSVSNLTQIQITFSKPVVGVHAADLWLGGRPADAVTGSGSIYQFSVTPPPYGPVTVFWREPHGIMDLAVPPNPFDSTAPSATWTYDILDGSGPYAASIEPAPGATINELEEIAVTFSEPVYGVQAGDLLVNGQPADSVAGHGAGPYLFSFSQPGATDVTVAWAPVHGIFDRSPNANPFAGFTWNYTLSANSVFADQIVINEIMYHPASERIDEEWVELLNVGDETIDLTGWALNRGVDFIFPSVVLEPGAYLVVAADVDAFNALHPGVTDVVGGWEGRLSNSRDEIEVEDAAGERVDLVAYADEGDFADRVSFGASWEWVSDADGGGKSLELRNPALPNEAGRNWSASVPDNGTPGAPNSNASPDIAPLILDLAHFPPVPRSSETVTVTAQVLDESSVGLSARLWYRNATSGSLPGFVSTIMRDDGSSNDGAPGDGVFGAVLPAMAAGTIIEFYVEATDAGAQSRTSPAPGITGGNPAQQANAYYQVDDEFYGGNQPIHRLIMNVNDQSTLLNQSDRVIRNVTLVTVEGDETDIRYSCGVRRRGASSFGSTPPTMKLEIPTDRTLRGKSSFNLNSVNVHSQVLGSAISLKAGLPTAVARAVQLRFNGSNQSSSGGGQFGSYAEVEVLDGEWARDHFPHDGNGNVYSKRRPECGLLYQGPNPQNYMNCAYDKESNNSENDWTDLMNLTFALDPSTTPDEDYLEAIRENVNVELWLRYFAVLILMNYNETSLATGDDDDYNLYRGLEDPRFMVVPHDYDALYGTAGNSPNDLFQAANVNTMNRFLRHPEIEPLFYAEYRRQLAGMFSTNNLLPLFDQVLGDWVPAGTIQALKNNALNRIQFVSNVLPPAASTVRATVSGEPPSPTYYDGASLTVGGAETTHYRYRLNGGPWSEITEASQPIVLSGLSDGTYTVFVIGRNNEGVWQDETDPTISDTWTVRSDLRGVVINEILANNAGAVDHSGTAPDVVELFNAGTETVNLAGLTLSDDPENPDRFVFPPGTVLDSGQYMVLYANDPDGTAGLHLGFALSQNGETLYLRDTAANGFRILDEVTFGLQLRNRSVGRLAHGAWGLCQPTFGGANMAAATGNPSVLLINEWLADPAAPIEADFLEIYNPDALPVPLEGLSLTDQPLGDPFRHRIAPLSFIEGLGYAAFQADGMVDEGADHVSFGLSKSGGEIALVDSDGRILNCIFYTPQPHGLSQGRTPNGGPNFVFFDVPTPGAGNPTEFIPDPPRIIPFIAIDDAFQWRYHDGGEDLGTAWRAPDYDDSQWPEGAALLGVESAPLPEPIRTSINMQDGTFTYYFRSTFYMDPALDLSGLQISYVIDDGAVIYLNGEEIHRVRLDAGPVDYFTAANDSVDNAVYEGPFQLPFDDLLDGTNSIAVEVHQGSFGSSDVVFGLRLEGVIITNNPSASGIQLNEILANNQSVTNADGTATDWVELYNPSTGPADLAGMSLTDQLSEPRRWVFPPGSVIPAMGYLTVRFDSSAPATTNTSLVLNTGFGLAASGDSVYLFSPPGAGAALLDAVSFGLQAPDWSIGRPPGNTVDWILNLPTPGAMNLAATLGDTATLKINEWMADPDEGDDWFEVYNPNAQPVAVGGLHLTDNLNNRLKHRIPALSFMAAGADGYQVFLADDNTGSGADHVNFRLSAGGESVGLADAAGTLIHSVTFGAQEPNVAEGCLPDGAVTTRPFPDTASPGESNHLPLENIFVNEILTHSDPPFEDAIELWNASAVPVDISGWFMSDARNTPRKFQIPEGTLVPAFGYHVFYEAEFNANPGGALSFSLSSVRGDEVHLFATDGQGNLTGFLTTVEFGPAENGVSFGRHPTSVGVDFTALRERTFGSDDPANVEEFRTGAGATNAPPLVGPVVISEIMYHPPQVEGLDNAADEFIELRNVTAFEIPLHDPGHPANTWRLRDAVDFDFPPDTVLPPGSHLLVVSFNPASDPVALASFRARQNVSPLVPILGPYRGLLNNAGENVELYKPDPPQLPPNPDAGFVPYILVDRVNYSDESPWPVEADGAGPSLQRIDVAAYGNDPVNWAAAPPTPGLRFQPNTPPVLPAMEDWNVLEFHPVSFTAQAVDTNVPSQQLVFSLEPGAPSGASITSDGEFFWRPSEHHGGETFDIAIRVTDNGTPNLSATGGVRVVVEEVNRPPYFLNVAEKHINAGRLIFFQTGVDYDLPAQTLSFSLELGAPSGVTVHPQSGLLEWRPTEDQAPGTYSIIARATDDGVPPISSTQEYIIHVLPADETIVIVEIFPAAEGIVLEWFSTPGKTYRVETTETIDVATWKLVSEDVIAQGERTSFPHLPTRQCFYRVIQMD